MYCSSHVSRLLLCAFIAGQVDLQKGINGMPTTQFDHARLDFLSLVIWSRVVWPSVTRTYAKHGVEANAFWPSVVVAALRNLWLLLVNSTMSVKNDHRSKFSNLSNWKEEAWMSARKSKLQVKLPLIKTTKKIRKTVFSCKSHCFEDQFNA